MVLTRAIQVRTLRPVNADAIVWRTQGRMCLTVVAKATFGMVPEGTARLVAPMSLCNSDQFVDNDPSRSVLMTSDYAPYRPRVDVLLRGHAYNPGLQPAPTVAVRMSIYGDNIRFEKTLHVMGEHSSTSAVPLPFERMPLTWERARHHPEDNPVGVMDGQAALPNLLDPSDPSRPAGYGPIPESWGARSRLLGSEGGLTADGPVLNVPNNLIWDYFQAAPADQQLTGLSGDEVIVLDNLHRSLTRFQTQLPSARAVARLFGGDAPSDGYPLELDPDTLLIEPDRQMCSIVWRGCLMIEGTVEDLHCLGVVAGVELPGYPMPWERATNPAMPVEVAVPEAVRTSGPAPTGLAGSPSPLDDGVDDDDEPRGSTVAFSPEEAQRMIADSRRRAEAAGHRAGGISAFNAVASAKIDTTRPHAPPPPPSAPRVSQLDLDAYRIIDATTGDDELTALRAAHGGSPDDGSDGTLDLDESTGVQGEGSTRALTPEQAAALLSRSPSMPGAKLPPLETHEDTSTGQRPTRALSPHEAKSVLAQEAKTNPGVPTPRELAMAAEEASVAAGNLPGASEFFARVRPPDAQQRKVEEPDPHLPPTRIKPTPLNVADLGDDPLGMDPDAVTGPTLAITPESASALLNRPVPAVVAHPPAPVPKKRSTLIMEDDSRKKGR